MTACCPVGKHAQADAIDRAIRAQQAASLANASTSAPSYSQIARTYGIRKATLFAHRDECLADRSGVPVRSDDVPVRTAGGADDENASGSARVDRYAGAVPARNAEGVDGQAGRATGPPGDGTDRHNASQRRVPDAAQIGAVTAQSVPGDRDADVVASSDGGVAVGGGEGSAGAGRSAPPTPHDDSSRARAKSAGTGSIDKRWAKVRTASLDVMADHVTRVATDSDALDPNAPRAHGSYIHELVELVHAEKWDGELTASRLAREWNKPKLFVLGCFRDACTLMRIARGGLHEERELSLRRWMNLYRDARDSDEKGALKIAAEALKGYDAAAGIVDKSTRVQVNIAQSDEARAFVQIFLDEARGDPALLERIRRRLAEARDRLGDPTAILATADAAE